MKKQPVENRGGARKGAGKKPGPKGTMTPLTIKLPPLVQEFLATVKCKPDETKPLSKGEFITSLIEKSAAFKAWKQQSGK